MASPLLSLDEAAARLGVSSDELLQLLDKREIFGIKDGAAWKFKEEEIERFKRQMEAGASSVGSGLELPLIDDENGGSLDDDDLGLVTDELLGESDRHTSSTIIGKAGADDAPAGDSDLTLASDGDSDLTIAGDSDVELVPEEGLDSGSSGSGLKLIATESVSDPSSDLDLVDLESDSGLPLAGDSPSPGSDIPLLSDSDSSKTGEEPTVDVKPGSDLTLGSDLTMGDSDLELGDDEDSYKIAGEGSSNVSIADDGFDDDDIVLGGSSSGVGSGIGDSGINLTPTGDSGFNLEEAPLELGGEDGVASEDDSGEIEDLASDDDFLLTPMLELDDQDSESSGSQVIALDTEEEFDEHAATVLGEDVPGMQALEEAAPMAGGMGAAQPLSAGGQMFAPGPAVPQAQHSVFTISMLVLCFITLGLTGGMMYEMIRHIWSWDQPMEVNATIMDSLLEMIEGK